MKNAKTWHERGTHVERRPSPPVDAAAALRQPCPRCLAAAQAPCRNEAGKAVAPHGRRFAAAKSRAERGGGTQRGRREPVPIEKIRPVPEPQRPVPAGRMVRGVRVLPGQGGGAAVRPGEALEVACPKCASPAGTWCPGPDGKVGTHKERIAAARQARLAARQGPNLAPSIGRQLTSAQVACPVCRAPAGQPCPGPAASDRGFHPQRSLEARRTLYGAPPTPPAKPKGAKPKGAKRRDGATATGPVGNNPYMAAAQELAGKRPSQGRKRSAFSQRELDAQYRRALATNPGQATAMRSAGAARGGRGASRKGTGLELAQIGGARRPAATRAQVSVITEVRRSVITGETVPACHHGGRTCKIPLRATRSGLGLRPGWCWRRTRSGSISAHSPSALSNRDGTA